MFQQSFPSVSHPHQTSLITFKFVLHFCADYLSSFLQATEEIPLAVRLRKFCLYTFSFKNWQAPTDRGANPLVLLCKRGIQLGFPRAGKGVGVAELPLPLCSSQCSSNEFGTYSSQIYSAGLAQRDKWNFTTHLGGCCYHRHGWNCGMERLDSLFKGMHIVWPVKVVKCSCPGLNMWHFEIISGSAITDGRAQGKFWKARTSESCGWNKICIQGKRSKTPFLWGQ